MEEYAIIVDNLKKGYGKVNTRAEILKGLNFEMKKGEFCAIMGTSGCGKSTLMGILCGLERADVGSCKVNGRELNQMNDRELASYRNKEIGIVFQGFYLDETRNLIDNIAMPLGYSGIPMGERHRRAEEILREIGLLEEKKKRPSQISGGEQQRIAIARAVINRPQILLADEPTGNLDEENTKKIMELLVKLNQKGMGIVLVTHDKMVADYADRRFEMYNGILYEIQ